MKIINKKLASVKLITVICCRQKQRTMNYQEFKAVKTTLENNVESISNVLNSEDWKNEKIRMSDSFQSTLSEYKTAFELLRNFNKVSSKENKRQYSKEKRAAWRN